MSTGVSLEDLGAQSVKSAVQESRNRSRRSYQTIEDAFPDVDPMHEPFGDRVLVQLRSPAEKTEGGIILTHDSQDTEKWNTQVAKVLAIGPVAFKNRDTLEPWKEGAWCSVGEFVRVPKYGADRWEVPVPDSPTNKKAIFMFIRDNDLGGRIKGDPLQVIAYI